MIGKRLIKNSCNRKKFEKATPTYEKALISSGYNEKLQFHTRELKSKKLNRERNIILSNPSYNESVTTNSPTTPLTSYTI